MGLFLVFFIAIILAPMTLLLVNTLVHQNRISLMDRNIKTSRELAESVNIDYMQSFSTDWNRDVFQDWITLRTNPRYAGLGEAESEIQMFPDNLTMEIWTKARYFKPGTDRGLVTLRGVRSVFTWRNDVTRFGLVYPQTVDFAVDYPGAVPGSVFNHSAFVQGNLRTEPGGDITLGGFWVVRGTFTLEPGNTVGAGAVIHCTNLVDNGGTIGTNAIIRQGLPIIDLRVIDPGANGGMDDFAVGISTKIEIVGFSDIILDLDDGFLTYTQGGVSTVYTYPLGGRVGVAVFGTDVLLSGIVTSKMTVAVFPDSLGNGGNISVVRDLVYKNHGGATAASSGESLAVLSSGILTFIAPVGVDQHVDGVYYASNNRVDILNGSRDFFLHGTIHGRLNTVDVSADNIQITPDPLLLIFAPPRWPRAPEIITWDFIP